MAPGAGDVVLAESASRTRREFKYLLAEAGDARAVAFVRGRVSALREEFPPRQVSSLYFDSMSYTCFRQSNAGASERIKLRLRWYGTLQVPSPLTVEFKHRANHLGWKTQCPLGVLDLSAMPLRDLSSHLASFVPAALRPVAQLLRRPVLVTTYRRHYFATSDGEIRVTVDTALRFHDQRMRARLGLTSAGIESRFAVVECKLAQARERDATRLCRSFAPRHRRFSKYCHALEQLSER